MVGSNEGWRLCSGQKSSSAHVKLGCPTNSTESGGQLGVDHKVLDMGWPWGESTQKTMFSTQWKQFPGHFGAERNFDQPPVTVSDLTEGFATIAYDPEKFRCQTHLLGRAHRSVTLLCGKYRIDKK